MKKLSCLIELALILALVLTGCSLLSNVGQVPATGQKCVIVSIEEPICLGAGGGKIIGFWDNKNGQKILLNNCLIITFSGVLSDDILEDLSYTNDIALYLKTAAKTSKFS